MRLVSSLIGICVCACSFAQQPVLEWSKRFPQPSQSYWMTGAFYQVSHLVLDNAANVIVTGHVDFYDVSGFNLDSSAGFVMKYTNSGNWLWTSFYGNQVLQGATVNDVTVSSGNDIYITGQLNNGQFLAKFNASGFFQWDMFYNPYANTSQGMHVYVGNTGDIIVTGSAFNATGVLKPTACRYTSAGAPVFQNIYYSATAAYYGFADSYLATDGTLYILSTNNATPATAYIAKVSTGGTLINTFNAYASGNILEVKALDLDAQGNMYVGCNYVYNGMMVIRMDAYGGTTWTATHGDANNTGHYLNDVRFNPLTRDVYVTGFAVDTATYQDVYTVKFDSTGTFKWVQQFDTTGNDDFSFKIVFDKAGGVYSVNTMHVINESIVLLKYNPQTGARIWTEVQNTNLGNDHGRDIFVDTLFNIYACGWSDSVNMGVRTLKYNQNTQTDEVPGQDKYAMEPVLYPVPATDYVFFKTGHGHFEKYALYDASGRLVSGGTLWENKIPVNMLPPGNYIIRLVTGDKMLCLPFAKE